MNGDSFTTQLQPSTLLSLGLDHWNPKQVGSYSCNFPPVSSEILWDVFHIVSHPLKIPNLPLRQHCSLHLPDTILEASAEISQYVFWPHLNTSWQCFPFGSPSARCRCKVLTRRVKYLFFITCTFWRICTLLEYLQAITFMHFIQRFSTKYILSISSWLLSSFYPS